MRLPVLIACATMLLSPARAAEEIPVSELERAPSPARLAAIREEAARQGWGVWVQPLRNASLRAYESNSGEARSWYYLFRWAALLATPERIAVNQWIQAVNNAKVGHSNMAATYPTPAGSLSSHLSAATQAQVTGSPSFSEELFTMLKAVDNPVAVLDILETLHAADAGLFGEFGSLAVAIAVVYDVPPPPVWPHGQVSQEVLPRRWPVPKDAFLHWIRLDRGNHLAHRLKRLPAAELKFVIDSPAPFRELDWARQNVTMPLAEFAKAYDMVKYRKDRLVGNVFMWPGKKYDLATILHDGGICADQAYFASVSGKARGIPTLLFRGAGLDGRHAWFGYLSTSGWVLDCGRYAEQKFVSGEAFDPQTWLTLSDHDLVFLTERFRELPLYRLSQLNGLFAEEYLRDGRTAEAVKAAREAVNRERRNLDAWNTLLRAQEAANLDPREIEGTMREAALAFQRYPDLEIHFQRRVLASLRARGETSAADHEERMLARKYQGSRTDLAYSQAAQILLRSMTQDDLATRIRVFDNVLRSYGQGAGIDFFDKIVAVFVEHLQREGQIPAAVQMIDRARSILKVDSGSQLDHEMNDLRARLMKG